MRTGHEKVLLAEYFTVGWNVIEGVVAITAGVLAGSIALMAIELTSKDIARKYERFAQWYDFVEGIPDVLGVRKLRKRLLRRAAGKSC